MTKSEIITDVKEWTEHKADEKINFERAFDRGLQKFCQSKTFWWRAKTYSYTATAGDTTKDLSDLVRDFEAFISVTLWEGGTKVASLEPCFDPEAIIELQETTATAAVPDVYTLDPGTTLTLRFGNPLDKGYKVVIAYWAIPNPGTDDTEDTIPLVPAIYHHALFSRLKMDVAGFLYGVDSKPYGIAVAEYAESVEKAQARPGFSTKKTVQAIDPDDDAVRSTGNNDVRY